MKVLIDEERLRRTFGVTKLHEHQRQAIAASCSGRDVLVICPTGGGKSLGFWAAGLLTNGLTIVLSPLLALQADQVRRLGALGLDVVEWNSTVRDAKKREIIESLNHGWSGFLYTTPESLRGRELQLALKGRVGLAVIDEAHCALRHASFRPFYAHIAAYLDDLGVTSRYACTATLPGEDHPALIESLGLRDPFRIVTPVARSNLSFTKRSRDEECLLASLRSGAYEDCSAIVFVATRRESERLASILNDGGLSARFFHGNLKATEKKESQNAFMSGKTPIMCATNAFGLGVDKADIRVIVHWDAPGSIEDWTQEFGRAGRDELPAEVAICERESSGVPSVSFETREWLVRNSYPAAQEIKELYDFIARSPAIRMTATNIGQEVFGQAGKYLGSSCMAKLRRFRLVDADPDPKDGRKRIYRRTKLDWSLVNWDAYQIEAQGAFDRFDDLRRLWLECPADRLAEAIDRHFAVLPGHASEPYEIVCAEPEDQRLDAMDHHLRTRSFKEQQEDEVVLEEIRDFDSRP